jgi:hypothetical protein
MRDQLRRHHQGAAIPRDLSGTETATFCAKTLKRFAGVGVVLTIIGLGAFQQAAADDSKKKVIPIETSTIPANGDLNPYGVAFVPDGFPKGGKTEAGDILVSNFNASSNAQGTGMTIVSISSDGKQSLFFQGTPPLGLTTALGVLKKGFVIVGNLPTSSGAVQPPGSLIILDKSGNQVAGSPFVDPTFLDGPWDLTVIDKGNSATVFVSCVLNGTVTRFDLNINGGTVTLADKVTIASGYTFGPNSAALVVGPTGLAYDSQRDILYVASTADNEIFAVADAAKTKSASGPGNVIFSDSNHLHGPLGLALAPNGNLISSQGDAINQSTDPAQQSEIVEFTAGGKGGKGGQGTFVTEFSIDSAAGAAFGIAIERNKGAITFAAVDDAMNVLTVYDFTEK